MPQVEAGDCLIHCPHALGGAPAPVAPVPQTAVATEVAEKEGAVMGNHLAPGYCFLDEAEPIVAVTKTTTADSADQSIHSGLALNRAAACVTRWSLGCCSAAFAVQDSPRGDRYKQGPAKTDNCGLVQVQDGVQASSSERSQQPADC